MTTGRTIAVGFAGSPDARGALRWALDEAKQTGADVVVVHAVGLLEHTVGRAAAGGLEAAVHELVDEIGIDPGRVRVNFSDGDPCSALARAARAPIDADLLVVGSRGQEAHAGLLIGSTSLELADHVTVPLVIVPTSERGTEE